MGSTVEVRKATATMIAQELGVSVNQCSMWHARRHKNGFPEAIGRMEIGEGRSHRLDAKVWDLDEVLRWHAQYVPDRGGRKPGK